MRIVTLAEVSEHFRISKETARRNIKLGIWPYLQQLGRRPYRLDLDQIEAIVRDSSLKTETRQYYANTNELTPRTRGVRFGNIKKTRRKVGS